MSDEKKKPAKVPSGLMDLYEKLREFSGDPASDFALRVVRACDKGAPVLRRETFAAVEELKGKL